MVPGFLSPRFEETNTGRSLRTGLQAGTVEEFFFISHPKKKTTLIAVRETAERLMFCVFHGLSLKLLLTESQTK